MTKDFALHFTGSNTKVGMLNLQISPEVIALVTEIPRGQERWFKNFRFDMEPCKVFIKPEFSETELTKAVPKDYINNSYTNLLFNIQRYFTYEGRYQKVYSYHFKLLLHFTGMISLDFPYFLFRSVAKMADKVLLKSQGCETSLFHHGLIKLIVLHELKRINKEWYSFLFLCDFGAEKQGVDISPRVKGTPSVETSKSVMSRAKRYVKLKPRKQVKEQVSKAPVVILETPKSTKEKMHEVKGMTQEQSTSKPVQKILTRSQIAKEKGKTVISREGSSLKGDLKDILKAIDIAESRLVQADVIKSDQGKSKKMKPSKKLEFEDDVTTFVFKPRKPLTKQSKKM